MWSTAREIAAGDTVIVWLTRDVIQHLIVTPGKNFNSKFGNYRHSDLVGMPYGSKVGSRTGKGFIHVLRPTPELWTMALPHRTQILYLADIAFITSYLNITRGSRVIEAGLDSHNLDIIFYFFWTYVHYPNAGTGSGSFSHSLIRTIGTSGHLWTYEFHEVRASKAQEEFTRHGLSDVVTLTHRNVCKDGFTITDMADAVFLDLPAPWEAVEHAKMALRKDCITRICCFSPCMEQVLRTVNALNDAGFVEITMYETLLRPHDVSQAPTLVPIAEIAEKLKKAEQKREEKRLRQIATNNKRKRETELGQTDDPGVDESLGTKRAKTENEDATMTIPADEIQLSGELDLPRNSLDPSQFGGHADNPVPETKISVSKVLSEVRGHTSYLTFACLLPNTPGTLPTGSLSVEVESNS